MLLVIVLLTTMVCVMLGIVISSAYNNHFKVNNLTTRINTLEQELNERNNTTVFKAETASKYLRTAGPSDIKHIVDKKSDEETKNSTPTLTTDSRRNRVWKNSEGFIHREDGPALDYADGYKAWYINGKRHRTDGPAIEYGDGYKAWHLNGEQLTEEEFNNKIKSSESTMTVDSGGSKHWRNSKGEWHRTDGPACEHADGNKYWYQNGLYHREGGPAIEWASGTKFWYQNNRLHRLDGPAVEWASGVKEWFINGKQLTEQEFNEKTKPESTMTVDAYGNKNWRNSKYEFHRIDGPARIRPDGAEYWYQNNLYHREDGPAIVDRFGKFWYLNGKRHRTDGPAMEYVHGTKRWYLNGKQITEQEFNEKTNPKSTMTADECGYKSWRNSKGEYHRTDGPAIEHLDGRKFWYINGVRHREDGPAFETESGYKAWWVNGKRHRTDGPAIEYATGDKQWWIDDKKLTEQEFIARTNPESTMTVDSDGTKNWKNNKGQYHRINGPALEKSNGSKYWIQNGRYHREGGPAIVSDNGRFWYLDGELHRVNRPAIIRANGDLEWYKHGKRHRSLYIGPAIVRANGERLWFAHGERVLKGIGH